MFKKLFKKALKIEKRLTLGLFPIKKVDKDDIAGYCCKPQFYYLSIEQTSGLIGF